MVGLLFRRFGQNVVLFIAIITRSTLIEMLVYVKVLSMCEIDLFKSCSYLIGSCARNILRNITKNVQMNVQ